MDITAIKARLNQLQQSTTKTSSLWKPSPGKTQVRIVPYKFNKDNPFIELYFHYDMGDKFYLSPISFGRPDPIEEFATKLKTSGNSDDIPLVLYGEVVTKNVYKVFEYSPDNIEKTLNTQIMLHEMPAEIKKACMLLL